MNLERIYIRSGVLDINRMDPVHCSGLISFFCISCSIGLIICWCISIYFFIDLEQDVKLQLIDPALVPNYVGMLLVIVLSTVTHWQFYKYDRFVERERVLEQHSFCPNCAKNDLIGLIQSDDSSYS